MHYHYVRELISDDYLHIEYINIKNMLTNELIKTLKSTLFKKFVRMLSIINNSIRK